MAKSALLPLILGLCLLSGCTKVGEDERKKQEQWFCSYYGTCEKETDAACALYGNCGKKEDSFCSFYGNCK